MKVGAEMSEVNNPTACGRAEDLVAFLYGELADREARSFEQHRGNCPVCESELAGFGSIRRSITAWRDQSLKSASFNSTTDAPVAAGQSHRPSALAAIRSFFELSPLWMKAATGFAVVILCLLSALAVLGMLQRSTSKSPVFSARYSQKDFDDAVNKEVKAQLDQLASRQKDNDVNTTPKNEEAGNKPVRSFETAQRTMTASVNTPQKQRKPLTRAERNQLAADLRLTVNKDEDKLQLLGERINRDERMPLSHQLIS